MDWDAIWLSIRLAFWTTVLLIPAGVVLARILVWRPFRAKGLVEALVALPLVLPPTVLGYYLLTGFGRGSVLGGWYESLFGGSLAFSFSGLLAASLLFNLPFAVHPTQRAFEGLPRDLREA
ncbi:MAG: ABC transporter permease subunit, partial [Pseudomonadota bacterium]|nr:ABC transporter permease subunit [Pseudomonadota bacterium]